MKLTDFGIALALGAESATRTGTLLGSVQYVAPELVRGESATPLSDVYALGVVLYEIATGHLPFSGDTPMAIAMQHLDADPRRPTAWNPGLPSDLEAIVMRAMAKLPSARFASAADLGAALRAVERGDASALQAILAVPPAVGAGAAAPASAPTAPGAAPTTTASWGQPGAASPWGAAAGAAPERTQTMAPLPSVAAGGRPWTAPPPPTYTSPRWPVLLLGLISLLCVLGLVPLGMMAYRQVRLPTTPPRPVPGQGQLSPLVDPSQRLAAAGIAYTLIPSVGADRAGQITGASITHRLVPTPRPPMGRPADRADRADGACANI